MLVGRGVASLRACASSFSSLPSSSRLAANSGVRQRVPAAECARWRDCGRGGFVEGRNCTASTITCPCVPSLATSTKFCPAASKRYSPSETNRPSIGGGSCMFDVDGLFAVGAEHRHRHLVGAVAAGRVGQPDLVAPALGQLGHEGDGLRPFLLVADRAGSRRRCRACWTATPSSRRPFAWRVVDDDARQIRGGDDLVERFSVGGGQLSCTRSRDRLTCCSDLAAGFACAGGGFVLGLGDRQRRRHPFRDVGVLQQLGVAQRCRPGRSSRAWGSDRTCGRGSGRSRSSGPGSPCRSRRAARRPRPCRAAPCPALRGSCCPAPGTSWRPTAGGARPAYLPAAGRRRSARARSCRTADRR